MLYPTKLDDKRNKIVLGSVSVVYFSIGYIIVEKSVN